MLPPALQTSPVVYTAARFRARAVDVKRRDGGVLRREIVEPADAVLVVPVLENGSIVWIRNRRFAVGQTLWEMCAGTLEPGEPPEACAGREVVEETGYRAGKLQKLTEFFTCPGFCTELMHVFLGTRLEHVGQHLDETEQIEVEVRTLDESLRMIRTGEVRDGKSIAGLLYYHSFIAGR